MFISHFKSLSGKARHQGLLTHDRGDSFTTLLVLLACEKTTLLRMIAGFNVLGEVKQMGADACLLLWMVQNAITPHKSDSLVGSNDKRMTLTPLSSSCVGSDSRRGISPSHYAELFSETENDALSAIESSLSLGLASATLCAIRGRSSCFLCENTKRAARSSKPQVFSR